MLCAQVFESDSEAAGFALFISLSLSLVLTSVKSIFARALTPQSNEECIGVPKPLVGVLLVEAAFIMWLFMTYSPVSFSAEFMICRIGFLTLILSCVCALLVPIFIEIRNSLMGVLSSDRELERIEDESKNIGEKEAITKTRRVPANDKIKEGVTPAEVVAPIANEDRPADAEKASEKNSTNCEVSSKESQTKVFQTDEPANDSVVAEHPVKYEAVSSKEEKTSPNPEKAAAKEAKKAERLRKKLEKQRKKDMDDGWDVI